MLPGIFYRLTFPLVLYPIYLVSLNVFVQSLMVKIQPGFKYVCIFFKEEVHHVVCRLSANGHGIDVGDAVNSSILTGHLGSLHKGMKRESRPGKCFPNEDAH